MRTLLKYSITGYYFKIITIFSVILTILTMVVTNKSKYNVEARGWTIIWLTIFLIYTILTFISAVREKKHLKPNKNFFINLFNSISFLFSLIFSLMSLSVFINSLPLKVNYTQFILFILITIIMINSLREVFINRIYKNTKT